MALGPVMNTSSKFLIKRFEVEAEWEIIVFSIHKDHYFPLSVHKSLWETNSGILSFKWLSTQNLSCLPSNFTFESSLQKGFLRPPIYVPKMAQKSSIRSIFHLWVSWTFVKPCTRHQKNFKVLPEAYESVCLSKVVCIQNTDYALHIYILII